MAFEPGRMLELFGLRLRLYAQRLLRAVDLPAWVRNAGGRVHRCFLLLSVHLCCWMLTLQIGFAVWRENLHD